MCCFDPGHTSARSGTSAAFHGRPLRQEVAGSFCVLLGMLAPWSFRVSQCEDPLAGTSLHVAVSGRLVLKSHEHKAPMLSNRGNQSHSANSRWLLRNPDPVPLRSSDPKFLEAVERRRGLTFLWSWSMHTRKTLLCTAKSRSSDIFPFLVRWWCGQLLPRIRPHLAANGGPIIAMQVACVPSHLAPSGFQTDLLRRSLPRSCGV